MTNSKPIKTLIIFTIIASLILSASPLTLADNTADDIKVTLNGENITFDQPPVIVDGRTLVPIRAVCEALGADVYWYEPEQGIMIVKNEIKLILAIGENYIDKLLCADFADYIDTMERGDFHRIHKGTLDVPPQIIDNRTFLPIRAVCEELGAVVDWDEDSRTVVITCDDEIINDRNRDTEFFDSLIKYFEEDIASANMPKDRIEYPLAKVDVSDSSEYVLVKEDFFSFADTCEIVTDTAAIKANKDIFAVDNMSELYGTTPDGMFTLYKDGEWIDSVAFDAYCTKSIEYGTLEFEPINGLQLQLLLGAEILEEGETYTIVRSAGKYPRCLVYAHGDDKLSPDKVFLVTDDSSPDELPHPTNRYGNIIEFVAIHEHWPGSDSSHWFFDSEELKLSDYYHDVKAVNGTMIVHPRWVNSGTSKIIISDMFDYKKGRREITGNFSETDIEKFLLEAEFRGKSELWVKYLLPNGEAEEMIYDLNDIPVTHEPLGK